MQSDGWQVKDARVARRGSWLAATMQRHDSRGGVAVKKLRTRPTAAPQNHADPPVTVQQCIALRNGRAAAARPSTRLPLCLPPSDASTKLRPLAGVDPRPWTGRCKQQALWFCWVCITWAAGFHWPLAPAAWCATAVHGEAPRRGQLRLLWQLHTHTWLIATHVSVYRLMACRPRGASFQRCTEAAQGDASGGRKRDASQNRSRQVGKAKQIETGRQAKAHRDKLGKAMDAAKHHLLIGIVVDESTEQNWAAPCCLSGLQGAVQVQNK